MFFVYERTGLREFLKEAAELFNVWLFTASKKEYADAILKKSTLTRPSFRKDYTAKIV